MTDRLFPIALRELRADFGKRPVLVALLALGLIFGISGPFNTLDLLPAVARILYWLAVVTLTFATRAFVSTIVHTALDRRLGWLAYWVSAAAISLAVNVVLTLINLVAFGSWYDTWGGVFIQLGNVLLISSVIEFGILALRGESAETPDVRVPLLDRLPVEKRGLIVALSAEDHYVHVATTKGTELVLMRLSDAIKQVGETVGLQVHRSHWIATDHIREVTRIADRAVVLSSDGITRPISRSYMAAAREAGLFPTGRNI